MYSRNNDQMGSPDPPFFQQSKEADDLDGLSET